jgi:hypothetical protein
VKIAGAVEVVAEPYVQLNFDKRDSLKQEKAYKREVFCGF